MYVSRLYSKALTMHEIKLVSQLSLMSLKMCLTNNFYLFAKHQYKILEK